MSLYYVQKLLYELNRDPHVRERYHTDFDDLLTDYTLTEEELEAIRKPDIGLLYVMGVNGQILMHYAAIFNMPWPEYLRAMEEGLEKYGPVRSGLYVMSDTVGDQEIKE